MSSSYPHDRDWEIPPEERDQSNTTSTARPYTEPIAQVAASQGPETPARTGDGGFQRQQRQHHHPQDNENDEPGLLTRLFIAIVTPILGFVIISTISLVWSGLLFGILILYTAAGNPLTGTVLIISVIAWMIGMKALLDVLYFGSA